MYLVFNYLYQHTCEYMWMLFSPKCNSYNLLGQVKNHDYKCMWPLVTLFQGPGFWRPNRFKHCESVVSSTCNKVKITPFGPHHLFLCLCSVPMRRVSSSGMHDIISLGHLAKRHVRYTLEAGWDEINIVCDKLISIGKWLLHNDVTSTSRIYITELHEYMT